MSEDRKSRRTIFGKQKKSETISVAEEQKRAADAFAEELKREFGLTVSEVTDTAEDLTRCGYHKLSEKAKQGLLPFLQYIPGFAANQSVVGSAKIAFTEATQGTFRPLLKDGMQLLESKSGSGNLRGLAMDKLSNARDIPEWMANNAKLNVSPAPQIAYGIFSAMSYVTGQYFLGEIDQKLAVINAGIREILQMLVDLEINELQAYEQELKDISERSQYLRNSFVTLTAALNQLHGIQHQSQHVIDLMRRNIANERNALSDKDKPEITCQKLQRISEYIVHYHYALHVYNVATLLELQLCGTMDPDEMEAFRQQILRRTDSYKSFYNETTKGLIEYLDNSKLNKHQLGDHLLAGGGAIVAAVLGGRVGRTFSYEVWKTLDNWIMNRKKKLKDSQYAIIEQYIRELSDTATVDAPAEVIQQYIEATRDGIEIVCANGDCYTNMPVADLVFQNQQTVESCATTTC